MRIVKCRILPPPPALTFGGVLFILGWLVSSTLYAQTTLWTGSSDSDFLNGGNWSNGLPTSAQPGEINMAAEGLTNTTLSGFTVTTSANISSTGYWTLQNGAILNVTSGTLIGGSSQHFRLGESGSHPVSILNVTGTGKVETYSHFLLGRAGQGEVNLRDSGYLKHSGTSFTIGDASGGNGTVNIYNNATLEINSTTEVGNHTGSVGTIHMYGGTITGSTTLRVGGGDSNTARRASTGYFYYTAGHLNVPVTVGNAIGATGTFTVKSGGILDATKNLFVGNHAESAGASLILEENAVLNHTSGTFVIGNLGTGSATIATGASLTSNALTLGNSGVGTLEIAEGGNATVKTLVMGNSAGASGSASVMGTLESTALTVGNSGSGTLEITEGGNALVGTLTVGNNASGTGTVEVSGENAKLEVTTGFTIGQNATGSLGSGETETWGGLLEIQDGGSFVNSGVATVHIGTATGSTGKVVVGEGGTANFGSAKDQTLYVGSAGTGVLHYAGSGEHALKLTVRLGGNGTGVGTLNIEKGTVNHTSGYIIVGHAGKGYLNVFNGGKLTSGNLYLGDSRYSRAHGEIHVGGTGLGAGEIQVTNFYVADKDTTTASINIGENGKIVAITAKIGYSQHWNDGKPENQQYGGSAVFNLDGGTFESNTFQIGKTSTVNIRSGSFKNTGGLSIYGTSDLNLENGTFVTGSITQNENSVIRFTQGTDFTANSYIMNDGRLEMFISSALEEGKEAYLEVIDDVQLLNGSIILDFEEAFLETLEVGTSLPILSAENLTTAVLSISGNTSIPSTFWSYHLDGGVLYADMGVPEPTSLLLLLGGFVGLLGWRRFAQKHTQVSL